MKISPNPFERGFDHFNIKRLVHYYSKDPNIDGFNYQPIHESQQHLKDYEFQNQPCICSDQFLLLDTQPIAEGLRAQCKYQGIIIRVVYRIMGKTKDHDYLIGDALTQRYAEDIIDRLRFTTGNFSRCWEISSDHLCEASKDFFDNWLKQDDDPYRHCFIEPFIIPQSGVYNYGVRLNHTPWINKHLKGYCHMDANDLYQRQLAAGVPKSLVDILHLAGAAGTRIVIFDPFSDFILKPLPTYTK